jgi:hypothetical protein
MPILNRKKIEQIRSRGSSWTAAGNYWLFATCSYVDGSIVSIKRCIRDARLLFNNMDRRILGRKLYKENIRLPRLVYMETGRSGANRHIHYYIKGYEPKHYDEIKSIAEKLWVELVEGARDCVIKDNREDGDVRAGYCWKEFKDYSDETLLVDCCYIENT